jgi:predicted permease
METLWQDVRYALRTLRSARLVVLVAAITIAIGVGATTTMLSVANALLLRPPAGVAEPDRLVSVHALGQDHSSFHSFSYPDFQDLSEAGGGLSSLAAYTILPASLRTGDEPRLEAGMLVSEAYFRTVGARPAWGRFFSADESRPGGPRVVVLSDRLWRGRFNGDRSVLGQVVVLNGEPLTVVGVTEPGFHGHFAGIDVGLWVPIALDPVLSHRDILNGRRNNWLELVGRLAPGVRPGQVAAALSPVAARSGRLGGLDWDQGVEVRGYLPVPASVALPVGGFLGLLLVLAGFILLIASANVGSVLLARASTRSREIAVRLALGARRGRLVRQLLTESLLLFLLGGAAGTALAFAATRALSRVEPPTPIPVLLDFHPDIPVLLAALLVTLIAGVAFGLAPALQATRSDPALILREGSTTMPFARGRLRGGLVAAQIAATACLLVTAGLFARALARAGDIDPGFKPEGVQVLSLELRVRGYEGQRTVALAQALEQRAGAIPGVLAVATTDLLPLNMSNQQTQLALPGRAQTPNVGLFETDFTDVTPGFFATMGIPLRRGRGFTPSDRDGAPAVAIVNETMARRFWPGEDPIGKRLNYGSFTAGTPTEVIGVAADAKYRTLGEDPLPMIYLPLAQQPGHRLTLLVRTAPGRPVSARALRDVLHEVDPELPVEQEGSFAALIGVALLPNRVAALLAALFGATGLVIAAVGLYGLLAFRVQSRRKEIGIRVALGARGRDIRRLVQGEALGVIAAGIASGLALAGGASRLLGSMLFGLSPLDPPTYGVIVAILLGVGWIAAAGPTGRALRTEPFEVLRHD